MINQKAFIHSLKAVWVRRLLNSDKFTDLLLAIGIDFSSLIKTGSTQVENMAKECKNLFWRDVLFAWNEVLHKDKDSSWETFLKSPLWYNANIKVDNKCVFFREWFQKGIQ